MVVTPANLSCESDHLRSYTEMMTDGIAGQQTNNNVYNELVWRLLDGEEVSDIQ